MFLQEKKVINYLKTKLYWFLKRPYKPKQFWDKWGKTFINESQQRSIYPQHNWILKILLKEKPKNLLEVGCGFGRNIKFITKHYLEPLSITGIDISSTMLSSARIYLHHTLNKHLITLKEGTILKLPFPSNSFDMVICHGVLMHIKPDDINKAIYELVRVAKRYIIVVEQDDTINPIKNRPFQKINHYTFTYPYERLFEKYNIQIIEHKRKNELHWFFLKLNL